jgi:hypothetical protein
MVPVTLLYDNMIIPSTKCKENYRDEMFRDVEQSRIRAL